MVKILIVGAGALGREVLEFCYGSTQYDQWDIQGFLDDGATPLQGYDLPYSVVGTIRDYEPSPNVQCILAIANPIIRKEIFTSFKKKGIMFATLIHASAYVSPTALLSEGCIVGPFASISAHARVGQATLLNFYANVGHDAILGDFSVMSVHSNINGFSRVGSCVFIGGHGVVLPHVDVGSGAIIGAGSVAMRRVKANMTVVGVPAEKFM